jgi:hypothetical protein
VLRNSWRGLPTENPPCTQQPGVAPTPPPIPSQNIVNTVGQAGGCSAGAQLWSSTRSRLVPDDDDDLNRSSIAWTVETRGALPMVQSPPYDSDECPCKHAAGTDITYSASANSVCAARVPCGAHVARSAVGRSGATAEPRRRGLGDTSSPVGGRGRDGSRRTALSSGYPGSTRVHIRR